MDVEDILWSRPDPAELACKWELYIRFSEGPTIWTSNCPPRRFPYLVNRMNANRAIMFYICLYWFIYRCVQPWLVLLPTSFLDFKSCQDDFMFYIFEIIVIFLMTMLKFTITSLLILLINHITVFFQNRCTSKFA